MCSSGCDGLDAAVITATLYKGIDEIVCRHWDPIGVASFEDRFRTHTTHVKLSSAKTLQL
jgi:hypothetical protein